MYKTFVIFATFINYITEEQKTKDVFKFVDAL